MIAENLHNSVDEDDDEVTRWPPRQCDQVIKVVMGQMGHVSRNLTPCYIVTMISLSVFAIPTPVICLHHHINFQSMSLYFICPILGGKPIV